MDNRAERGGEVRFLKTVIAAVVTAAILLCAENASAQNPTYIFGAVAIAARDGVTGEKAEFYLAAPGGKTAGITVGGGIGLTRVVGMDVEFSRGGPMKAREPYKYGETYNLELLENFLTIGTRFEVSAGRYIRFEPVTGFLLAVHEASAQEECCNLGVPLPYTVGPKIRNRVPVSPGLTLGLDVPIGNRRIAVLPSLRWYWTVNNLDRYFPGGYARVTWAPGVGVRFGF